MEAEPVPLLVERHDEQVGAFQLVEDRRGVGDAEDVVAQRGREPIQDRDADDEATHPLGVPVEHLFRQVVADEAVLAVEPPHEVVRIGATGQRQRREIQARRPAFRALHQLRDGLLGHLHVVVREQLRGLPRGEAEVDGADLGKVAGSAQTA
jgi:hypothetical protein